MRIFQSLLALDRTLTPEKMLRLEINIDEAVESVTIEPSCTPSGLRWRAG